MWRLVWSIWLINKASTYTFVQLLVINFMVLNSSRYQFHTIWTQVSVNNLFFLYIFGDLPQAPVDGEIWGAPVGQQLPPGRPEPQRPPRYVHACHRLVTDHPINVQKHICILRSLTYIMISPFLQLSLGGALVLRFISLLRYVNFHTQFQLH